ncbi:hypothetical protein [Streptomyces sp. SID2888]|uniref:hypothetical protein n=1 Tax=Streptomyces sp. SID2888 TaxID=2690256 RepID=UPI00136B8C2B|nr:hypothetical protein [Streptomyces sp. SID2888]MYV47128.1 hypothetical protein [Streptomyces sp. SID2888]
MHVNSELLNTAAGAVGAVALVFIGGWENGRRTRKAEERKDAAAARATLEAQADELVTAVLALKVAGHMHDQLFAGEGAKGRLFVAALSKGSSAALGHRGGVTSGLPAAFREAWRVVDRWEQDTAASAAGLAAPLSRLGAAVAPLMRREEPGLATATDAVFKAAVESHGDDDRMAQALETFHAALRPALAPPATAGRRRVLRRRRRASIE